MKDMKMTEKEHDALSGMEPEEAEYPYGLRIRLGNGEMEKLGMAMPKVGEMVTIHAKARVVACSAYENEGGMDSSCEIQIQEMDISGQRTAAEVLYGKKE